MRSLCLTLQALQKVIEQQKVEYDFGFYKLPQHTDAPVTIISEGRTLLQTNLGIELPLQPAANLCKSMQTRTSRSNPRVLIFQFEHWRQGI